MNASDPWALEFVAKPRLYKLGLLCVAKKIIKVVNLIKIK